MEFILKGIYILIFLISLLLVISLCLLSLEHWIHPFKKDSEAVILILGSIILSTGMYFSVKYGYYLSNLLKSLYWLVGSWVITILVITIGLLFFNGSQK